jgi:hypothetical protein
MAKRSTRATRSAQKKRKPDELALHKREFIETFFKRGAEFAEELMHENERLRFHVAELEQRQGDAKGGKARYASDPKLPVAELRERLAKLEDERRQLIERFAGVEQANKDYLSRYQEIERENNNLANLYVASHQLHSTLELREVTQIIVEILLNFIGIKTFAVQLVDEERGILRTLVSEGVERGRVPERSLNGPLPADPMVNDPVREVVRTGRPLFAHGRLEARPISAPPSIVVPLKIGERVVGLIVAWELLAQKAGLVDVDFELFNLLGDHAGSALQSAKLNTELEGRPPALWGAADLV